MPCDPDEFEMERKFPLDFEITADMLLAPSMQHHTNFGLVDGEPWSSAPPWTFDWSTGEPARASTMRFRQHAAQISRTAFVRAVAWRRALAWLRIRWDYIALMGACLQALISGATITVFYALALVFLPVVMILMPAWTVLQKVAKPLKEKHERNPEDEAWAVAKAEVARSLAPYKRKW